MESIFYLIDSISWKTSKFTVFFFRTGEKPIFLQRGEIYKSMLTIQSTYVLPVGELNTGVTAALEDLFSTPSESC